MSATGEALRHYYERDEISRALLERFVLWFLAGAAEMPPTDQMLNEVCIFLEEE